MPNKNNIRNIRRTRINFAFFHQILERQTRQTFWHQKRIDRHSEHAVMFARVICIRENSNINKRMVKFGAIFMFYFFDKKLASEKRPNLTCNFELRPSISMKLKRMCVYHRCTLGIGPKVVNECSTFQKF